MDGWKDNRIVELISKDDDAELRRVTRLTSLRVYSMYMEPVKAPAVHLIVAPSGATAECKSVAEDDRQ